VLCVSNEGPGIPDDDKRHIFERFYRAGNEEVRNTKGTGLGLFIVKNLLDLHKASVTVKDRLPSGVTFEIIFTANAA
jgi:signal transduction histidine kinase